MNTKTTLNLGRSASHSLMLVLSAASLLLAGCAVGAGGGGDNSPITVLPAGAMQGIVHGGQSPISGASIKLYAAGTTGYASANTNLLNITVTTSPTGTFNFLPANYTCTSGQQMYIVATGGNPGSGTNNNEVTVAALGDCSTLTSATSIQMNEVTTVAAAYALAPFATGYANIGTSSSNVNGLKRAFVNAAKLANYTNGTASGTLPSGATAPTAEIYSLANTIAACVNSTTAGTPCTNLFTYTTQNSVTPTDTFGAALNIAKYPASNVSNLYTLGVPSAPFASGLGSAPADWSVSIVYTGGSFNAPMSTTVDANGQVWVANSGNNTVSVLAQTGTPIGTSPLSGNGLNNPVAIAMDSNGNGVVANKGGGSLSEFNNSGSTITTGSVGSGPVALAFDAAGNLWVANSTGNSISEVSSGVVVQTITGVSSPSAIAIDPK